MGCKTRIQLIERKNSKQWYVNFPMAIAQAMEFEKGEEFEWIIMDTDRMMLRRLKKITPTLKIKNK